MPGENRRILVVDDNRAIHNDFRKILDRNGASSELEQLEATLFGTRSAGPPPETFSVDSAYQGQEAEEMVRKSREAGQPYALAFIDVRMPPGWDGIETAQHIWDVDPDVQVVICTAYSDYSWEDTVERLGENSERFLILKKPFDQVEVRQLAAALTKKWDLARRAGAKFEEMETIIRSRTSVLREAHDRLQREMEQRHSMEAQLRRAQKLEALGRLAAGVAHEINNPLAFVIANMHYVREALETRGVDADDLPPTRELCAALEEACVGGERIKQIVRDLKAFARPHDESLSTIDVCPIVEFSVKMTVAEIKRVAQLVTRIEPVPAVWAIGGRLEQVCVNLLINAAQAIPPGNPTGNKIEVSVRSADGLVLIEVADSGVGISRENLERVFDPFFTTKPVGLGTGLGLSICHSIVAAFGGDLTVESTVGKGTVFRVCLPGTDRPARPGGRNDGHSMNGVARILIVDPEPAITKALRRILSEHKVEATGSGLEALTMCRSKTFDLVLYDLMMGDLSGPEMYRRLQEEGGGAEQRLVFTCAGILPTGIDTFLAETKLPCLGKPFNALDVYQLLER